MNHSTINIRKSLRSLLLVVAFAPFAAFADSGGYIGAGIGGATLEANLGDTGIPGVPASLDEDDTAMKVFAGYTFDLPMIDLAVELGYVDFGAPEIDVLGEDLMLDTTGLNLWGIAAFEAGPVDLYAKVGYISWDVELELLTDSATVDGSDLGYGVGLSFGLAAIKVRGEYEVYDLDGADLSMLSVGLVYQFD